MCAQADRERRSKRGLRTHLRHMPEYLPAADDRRGLDEAQTQAFAVNTERGQCAHQHLQGEARSCRAGTQE